MGWTDIDRKSLEKKGNTDMDISQNDKPLLDEEIWQAWIQKCKLREQATARRSKKLAGLALALLAFGAVFYLLVIR